MGASAGFPATCRQQTLCCKPVTSKLSCALSAASDTSLGEPHRLIFMEIKGQGQLILPEDSKEETWLRSQACPKALMSRFRAGTESRPKTEPSTCDPGDQQLA